MRGTNLEHHWVRVYPPSVSHIATCGATQNRGDLGGVHQHFAFGTYAGPRIPPKYQLVLYVHHHVSGVRVRHQISPIYTVSTGRQNSHKRLYQNDFTRVSVFYVCSPREPRTACSTFGTTTYTGARIPQTSTFRATWRRLPRHCCDS